MSVIQGCFRPEHKAPPLPVLALIGEHDYQAGLADFLLNQLCAGNALNPIVCLRSSADPLGDQHFLDHAFAGGQDKGTSKADAGGIMKADWFAKHRSKRAAAALVLINRDELLGDFTSWNAMLRRLQDIQYKVASRGAGMLLAVLQTYEEGELPADCVASLCKSLNVSSKLICPLPVCMIGTHELSRSTEAVAALKSLGALAHEQCSAYYLRRVQHVTAKLARRAATVDADAYLQLSARAATKLAAYAEFRRDWRGAVSQYQAAYNHTRAILRVSSGQTNNKGGTGVSPSMSTRSSLSTSSSFSGLSSLAASRQNSSTIVGSAPGQLVGGGLGSSSVGSAPGQGAAAAGMPGRPVSGLGVGGLGGAGLGGGELGSSNVGSATGQGASAAGMPGRPVGGLGVGGLGGAGLGGGGLSSSNVGSATGQGTAAAGMLGRPVGGFGVGGLGSVGLGASGLGASMSGAAAPSSSSAAAAAPLGPSGAFLSRPPTIAPPPMVTMAPPPPPMAPRPMAPPPMAPPPPMALPPTMAPPPMAPSPMAVPTPPPNPNRSTQGTFPQTTMPPGPPPPPPPPAPSPPPPSPPQPMQTPAAQQTRPAHPQPMQTPAAAQQAQQHLQQPPHPLPYSSSIHGPFSAFPAPLQSSALPTVTHSRSIPAQQKFPSQTVPARSLPSQPMPAQSLTSQPMTPLNVPAQTGPHPNMPAQHTPPQRITPPPSIPAQNMPATRPTLYPTSLHPIPQQQHLQQQHLQQQQQQQQAHTGSLPTGVPSYPQAHQFVPQQRQQQPSPYATQVESGPTTPSMKPGSAQSAQPKPVHPALTPGSPNVVPGSGVTSAPSPQIYVQAARLAELLQLKLLMLLTVQERLDEAAAQAATHISLFATAPGVLGAAMDALQLSFLARQLRVVAEVVSPKFEAHPSSTWNSTAKGCSRSLLLLSAAQAAVEHRRAVDTLAASSAAASFDVSSVRPGQHLGQAVKLEQGSEPRNMTDAEFVAWMEATLRGSSAKVSTDAHPKSPDLQTVASTILGGGPKVVDSTAAAFEALEAAASAFKRRDTKAPRERALLCLLVGEELLAAGDLKAHTHLLAAAHTYRREAWPELLLHTLLLLAECAQHLDLPTEPALYTLEAAALQPCLPSEAAPAPGSQPSLPLNAGLQGLPTSPAPGVALSTGGMATKHAATPGSAANGRVVGNAAAAAPAAVSEGLGGLHAATTKLPISLERCLAAAMALLPPIGSCAAEHAQHAQHGAAELTKHAQQARASSPTSDARAAGLPRAGEDACDTLKRGHVFNVEFFDLEAREWFGGPGLVGAGGTPQATSQPGWVQPQPSQQQGGGLATAAAGSDGAGAGLLSADIRLALEAHHQKDFGWWRILAVSAGWAANTPPDTEAADCYVAVRSCLPKGAPALSIIGITLTLRDEDGEWLVPTTSTLPMAPSAQSQQKGSEQRVQQQQPQNGRCEQKDGQEKACSGLWPATNILEPSGRWIHAKATVAPRRLGRLEVTQVSVHLGPLNTAGTSPSLPSAHTPNSAQVPHGSPVPVATEAAGKAATSPTPASAVNGVTATINFFLASFPRPPPGPSSCLSTHSTLGGLLERFAGAISPPSPSPTTPKQPAGVRGSFLFPRPVPAPFKGLPAVDVRGGGGGGGAALTVTHLGRLPNLKLTPMPAACKPSCCFQGEPCCVVATLEVAPNCQGLPEGVLECATKPLSPGLLPRDITILTLNREGKLQSCSGTETARAHLPGLKPGMSHTLRLWVVCKAPGKLALGAALQCPAVVARVCEWEVQQPLQLSTRLCAQPGVHTLPLPMARSTTHSPVAAKTTDGGQSGSIDGMPNTSGSSTAAAPNAAPNTTPGAAAAAAAAPPAGGVTGGAGAVRSDGGSGSGATKMAGLASVASGGAGVPNTAGDGTTPAAGMASVGQQLLLECSLQCFGATAELSGLEPGGLVELLDVQVLPEPGFHLRSSLSQHPHCNLLLPHLPPDTPSVPVAGHGTSPSNPTPPSTPLPSRGLELGPGDALTLCTPIKPHSSTSPAALQAYANTSPPPPQLPSTHQVQQQLIHHHPGCPNAMAGAQPQQQTRQQQLTVTTAAPGTPAAAAVAQQQQQQQQQYGTTSHSQPPYMQPPQPFQKPQQTPMLPPSPPHQEAPSAATPVGQHHLQHRMLHGATTSTSSSRLATSVQIDPAGQGALNLPISTPSPQLQPQPSQDDAVRPAAAALHTAPAPNAQPEVPQGPNLTGMSAVCGGGGSAPAGSQCGWQLAKLGRLQVTWRRWGETGRQPQQYQDAGGEEPPHEVVSLYDLPAVAVCECSLSARVLAPAHATAGIAFSLSLQVQSSSPKAEQITAQLLDAPGFVLSGERAEQRLTLPPYHQAPSTCLGSQEGAAPNLEGDQEVSQPAVQGAPEKLYCTWLLVGHTPGRMVLPAIQLHASGLAGTSNATASLTARSPIISVAPI